MTIVIGHDNKLFLFLVRGFMTDPDTDEFEQNGHHYLINDYQEQQLHLQIAN
jgi:hypothetical protein